jgi:hypothetical protein
MQSEGCSDAEADLLPQLEAAQAALQQQEALMGQLSRELSPALVKYVKLEQQVRGRFDFLV